MTGEAAGRSPAEPVSVLPASGEGGPGPDEVGLEPKDLLEMYRWMALARRIDVESTALQRQGELAVYPPLIGQEAAQIGSAYALAPDDWAFPSYRELGVALVRGVDLVDYLRFHRATWHGGTYDAAEHRFGLFCVPIATQILHAVGFAIGTKLDGAGFATIVYFGDGATSEGDFHEGCNFAGVFGAPVVLFCQNNRWAISLPFAEQSAAPVHRKAEAYGFPGVRVDGNDVLAVHRVAREALERARRGDGPTLIEALTYRMAGHSTADDPTRYRTAEEVGGWRERDPLLRYERWLRSHDVAGDEFFQGVEAEAADLAARTRKGLVESGPRPVEELFEWVYERRPETLERQRAEVLERARRKE